MGKEILRCAQDDRAGAKGLAGAPDGHASAQGRVWLDGQGDPSLRSG